MEVTECSNTTSQPKRIKTRKIKHGNIKKASTNKNCPKFIIGYCWLTFKEQILRECTPDELQHVRLAFAQV
jgi:hypothetical protein